MKRLLFVAYVGLLGGLVTTSPWVTGICLVALLWGLGAVVLEVAREATS